MTSVRPKCIYFKRKPCGFNCENWFVTLYGFGAEFGAQKLVDLDGDGTSSALGLVDYLSVDRHGRTGLVGGRTRGTVHRVHRSA